MTKKATVEGATAPPKHNLTLQFTEPEDIQLYEQLVAEAKSERRALNLYTLLKLHELYENAAPAAAATAA